MSAADEQLRCSEAVRMLVLDAVEQGADMTVNSIVHRNTGTMATAFLVVGRPDLQQAIHELFISYTQVTGGRGEIVEVDGTTRDLKLNDKGNA
jgi:hypothetical protein